MNNLKLITTHKDYFLLVDENDRQWGKVAYNVDSKDVEFICSHPKYDEHGIKIVAHLPKAGAPLLKGVMLMVDLPLQEDEDEKRASKYADSRELREKEWFLGASGYMDGYKAASKQYTEDDIDAAFLAGSNHQSEVEELRFQAEGFNTALNRFKDSLSPVPVLPVDYALHTQACCDYICNGSCEKYGSTIVPITIPNEQGVEVLQGKWIY